MSESTASPDPDDDQPPTTEGPDREPEQPADPYAERSARDQILGPGDDPD
jgi:hypothetical protein